MDKGGKVGGWVLMVVVGWWGQLKVVAIVRYCLLPTIRNTCISDGMAAM